MLRVLFFFGLVLALAFGFAWLADRPGTVSLDWMGYQIELSAMLAMIGLVVLVVAVMVVWWLLKTILLSPKIMGGYFAARRRDRGYEALSGGLVAAGSGDIKAAERYAKEAKKLMPDAPLTQVLVASSADLTGDADGKRQVYRRMLDDPKTQILGLRGLYLDAVQDDDEEAARHYADQASALAPALSWAGQAQFEDQVQRGDWPAARAVLERNLQARVLTKTERNRLRAVLLTAEALDREQGEPEAARALAQEAHKLAPDLVPAAAATGRLLIRAGKMSQASKVIETTWRKAPHPELAEVYLYVRPGDAVADRVKRARRLAQLGAHDREGEMALARTLMEAGKVDEARTLLERHAQDDATQRVCLLMAEIEEKASDEAGGAGDTALVRSWMARALRAKRDPSWVADGYISSMWEPVSPLSGKVDAFEWKVPVERFAAHEPVAIPDDALREDGQVMLPARLPGIGVGVGAALGEGTALEKAAEIADPSAAPDAELVVEAEPENTKPEMPGSDTGEPDKSDDLPVVANDDSKDGAPDAPQADAQEQNASEADDASDASETVEEDAPIALPADDPEAEQKPSYSSLPRGQAPDDPGPAPEDAAEPEGRKRFRLF